MRNESPKPPALMSHILFVLILASVAIAQSVNEPTAITIPLDDGRLVIRDAQFIRLNSYGLDIPELSFGLTNETSSPWLTILLKFDIGGICNGQAHHWSFTADVGIGYLPDRPVMKIYAETIIPLMRKVDGCKKEIIKASLVIAANSTVRINGVTGERVHLSKKEKRRNITAQREAEAARQKQLVAERDARIAKDRADADAKAAKDRWDADAKAAEEKRRLRANCMVIYQNTIDRKVEDLTVREEEQVRACQVLGLYPPR